MKHDPFLPAGLQRPWTLLRRVERELDRLYDEFGAVRPREERGVWAPLLDVEEYRDRYVVRVDLPGVPRDAVRLEVEDGRLYLSGRRSPPGERPLRRHRRERPMGAFELRLRLPENVAVDEVAARWEEGVVEITLPKIRPRPVRRLPID